MSLPGRPDARLHSETLWRTDRHNPADSDPFRRIWLSGDYYVVCPKGSTPTFSEGRHTPKRQNKLG